MYSNLLSVRMSWKLNNVKHSCGYNDALFRVIAKEKKRKKREPGWFLWLLAPSDGRGEDNTLGRIRRMALGDNCCVLWLLFIVLCPLFVSFRRMCDIRMRMQGGRGNKLVPKRLICSWEKSECIKQLNRMKTVNTKTETHSKSSYFIYAKCLEVISDLIIIVVIFVALSSLVTTVPTLLDTLKFSATKRPLPPTGERSEVVHYEGSGRQRRNPWGALHNVGDSSNGA